jgi:hypothetical protein
MASLLARPRHRGPGERRAARLPGILAGNRAPVAGRQKYPGPPFRMSATRRCSPGAPLLGGITKRFTADAALQPGKTGTDAAGGNYLGRCRKCQNYRSRESGYWTSARCGRGRTPRNGFRHGGGRYHVETNVRIDYMRTSGRRPDGGYQPERGQRFASLSWGKKSISVNMTTAKGRTHQEADQSLRRGNGELRRGELKRWGLSTKR